MPWNSELGLILAGHTDPWKMAIEIVDCSIEDGDCDCSPLRGCIDCIYVWYILVILGVHGDIPVFRTCLYMEHMKI